MTFGSKLQRCWVVAPGMVLGLVCLAGCAGYAEVKPGTEIVRFDNPAKVQLVDVPADGKYGCYEEGKTEPLEMATLKRGQKLGFEVVSPDEGRGLMSPKLIGIAGEQRFLLPLGEKYAWKRM